MRDLKKKYFKLFSKLFPFLLLASVVGAFFWKFFIAGYVPMPADIVVGTYHPWLDYNWGYATGVPVKNPITTDVTSFIYPMQKLAVDLMKGGQWPLWNRYILAGTPLLANFQSAPFSFVNSVYLFFDTLTGWSLQVILQHFFAALFTYLLLRHWKVSKLGAVLGGVVFAFSGFNLIWSQWNGHALAAAFIPFLLLLMDRFTQKQKLLTGILISTAISLQLFSGYPQVVIYSLLGLGLFVLIKHFYLNKFSKASSLVRIGLFAVLFVGFALVLSAVQLLPAIELLGYSQRVVEPLNFSLAFLPWSEAITFIAPDFFGNHATGNYWGPTDYTTTTGFVGVVAIVLAIGALKKLSKSYRVGFSLVLGVFALVLSFPTPLSIFVWHKGYLGFNAASAHRALVLFNLSVALLSGLGVDALIERRFQIKRALFVPMVLVFIYGVWAILMLATSSSLDDLWKYQVGLRNLVLPTALIIFVAVAFYLRTKFSPRIIAVLFFCVCLFELFRFGWKYTPFSPRELVYPNTPIIDYLQAQQKPFRLSGSDVIPINIRMAYGLESLEGYDAVYPLSVAKYIAVSNSQELTASPQGRYADVSNYASRYLDIANTEFFLGVKKDGLFDSVFEGDNFSQEFSDRSTTVFKNSNFLPRAFIVYDWKIVGSPNEELKLLLDTSFEVRNQITLSDPTTPIPGRGGTPEVNYLNYSDQQSEIKVSTDEAGMLFVSDAYYPDWKAYIDGQLTKIYKADYMFRAVYVPQGAHVVDFKYEPKPFFDGLAISVVSWIAIFAFLAIASVRFILRKVRL